MFIFALRKLNRTKTSYSTLKNIKKERSPSDISAMTTPRKKKQFTVSNYGSFTEEIKWSWAPVSKTETEDGHVILRFDSTEVTRDVYMKTVETLMGLFPELPSILEFTNCDAEGVRMSKLAYSLLKITSYAQYLTPANLQAVSPPRSGPSRWTASSACSGPGWPLAP